MNVFRTSTLVQKQARFRNLVFVMDTFSFEERKSIHLA